MNKNVQNICNALTKPIVLIGLMGAGKTKIGGLLAKALDLPFVDADQEIERVAGCTIADIFETKGEAAFRDLERQVLEQLLSSEMKVIATGGGAVMNEKTANLIWTSSLSVWLRADLDVLVERTARGGRKRPLLNNGNPREILKNLMDVRYPVYAKADIVVETGESMPDVTLGRLMNELENFL